jgi:hypothetical protein
MAVGVYTKKWEGCFKALKIVSKKIHHVGRNTAPLIMDSEEVCGMDQRNIGNWGQDVFQKDYSTKLPLGALRALTGFDKRRGHHINDRTTFKGEPRHTVLARMIFPWIEGVKEATALASTTKGFLDLLKNLRWVIIQDCAILIGKHNRTHIFFDMRADIFNSELFKEYTQLLIAHVETVRAGFDVNIAQVLPGVLERMQEQTKATQENTKVTKELHRDVLNYQQENSASVIGNKVNNAVHSSFVKFATHIGQSLTNYSQDQEDLTTQNENEEHNAYVAINDYGEYEDVDIETLQIEDMMRDKEMETDMTADTTNVNQHMMLLDATTTAATVTQDESTMLLNTDINQTFETIQSIRDYWDSVVVIKDTISKNGERAGIQKRGKHCHV